MVKCEYCGLKLNGMGSVFADSGAGVSIIKCSRCHHYSYFLDEGKEKEKVAQVKLASAWSQIASALSMVAPAIATLGVWDLTVAYSTFRKVLENTQQAQERANNPIYNPMYRSGIKKNAEGEIDMPGSEEESGGGDEFFSYQTHEVSYDDAIQSEEAVIAVARLEEFLRGVIPHVVKYSLDKKDGKILKALGQLGALIREAKKAHRIAEDQQNKDYTRTYLSS